jgi:hypothetical protein
VLSFLQEGGRLTQEKERSSLMRALKAQKQEAKSGG